MPNATQNAYSVSESGIQIGLEAVRGTAALAADMLPVPVRSPKYKPDLSFQAVEDLQGSMVQVYDQIPGMRFDGHGWDGYPYMDSFPVLIAAELGSADTITAAPTSTTLSAQATAGTSTITVAGTLAAGAWIVIGSGATLETHQVLSFSSPTATLTTAIQNTQASGTAVTGLTGHQWSLLNNGTGSQIGNQPLSVTINDYDGEEWRQLTAGQLGKLTVKGNATGLVDYTCDFHCNPSVTPSTPTYTTTTELPPPGWAAVFLLNGTQVNFVEDWEFDMDRQVKAIPAITGNQSYFQFLANGLRCSGKLTVIEQSGSPMLTLFENFTRFPITILIYDTTLGHALQIHSTLAIFKTGTIERGAEGEVKVPLDFESLPSSSDAKAGGVSPVLVQVANGQTTAYAGH